MSERVKLVVRITRAEFEDEEDSEGETYQARTDRNFINEFEHEDFFAAKAAWEYLANSGDEDICFTLLAAFYMESKIDITKSF